jgi:hypothetical protein
MFGKGWGPAGKKLRPRRGGPPLGFWLFFNIRVTIPDPPRLSVFIRTGQNLSGALNGEFKLVKDARNMGRMVSDREFFFNDSGDHGTSPNTRMKSVGHRATIQDVCQRLQLLIRQLCRTTAPLSLQNPFHTVLLPMVQPERNLGSVHFEDSGNFRSCSPFHIEDHGMKSPCHTIGPFLGCLFTQSDELLDCPFSSMYSFGFHGISPSDTMIAYVALFMQGYISEERSHLPQSLARKRR